MPPNWQHLNVLAPDGLVLAPVEEQPDDIRVTMLKNREGESVMMRSGSLRWRSTWAVLLDKEAHGA